MTENVIAKKISIIEENKIFEKFPRRNSCYGMLFAQITQDIGGFP